jgi:DNA-binding LytR/AlgR family response regulator
MYYHSKKSQLFIWQYALWVLAEIIAMSLFYTLFEIIFLDDTRSFNVLLKESSINTSLILLLPYSTIWLYFSWKENKNKLEKLNNYEVSKEPKGKQMLNFFDEKKELRLSVRSDEVLWIEAADNYVKIYYLNKGKISTFMVRNALKCMEEYFCNTALTRCNRSVIVNFDKVKILRKEKDGIFLGLDQDNVPDIPVSKSYADRIMSKFSSYSV